MPKDGTVTRERLLDTAEWLVIENGCAATPVEQVISGAESSKGAFFHHFDSKPGLVRALVERYAAADVAHLRAVLEWVQEQWDDPARQLVEVLRLYEEGAEELLAAQGSCLYIPVLAEGQLADHGAFEPIVGAVEAWRKAMAGLITRAARSRPHLVGFDVDAVADHVFVTFEGAFLLCRATGDTVHLGAQLRVLRQLLESLLTPGSTTP